MDATRIAACTVLAVLALYDLRARRLPNAAVVVFALLYFVDAAFAGSARAALIAHFATGVAALATAALLFRLGWLGGGDVKLAAAVFLWSGPAQAARVLFVISVSGSMIGLLVLAAGRLSRRSPRAQRRLAWLAPERGVPYGIALALGGALALALAPDAIEAHRMLASALAQSRLP
ncbi:prepilin peptidase [Trinickia caryophylli]|uniref:Prepilin peptidase CpaA n=1 Tax=Trinickia caryophylli TaxID=28094 RepID=A0A1X7EXV8_TRICW|nr:prepilin peptidase [Trinickia caryophylli]PMS09653.1 peptidase A24 [Trinickia caryophylli]TRX18420.1 peptidase A24 [Trinickia caryophylli]WQE10794.1 prepilin peptidase [Trinickia caryophylli]SMF42232.1 prepilin peptidase CpaA [Trinickia caryophylli]GLU33174.1 fimbriae assembly protein [Trinickia caryophylli]